MNKSCHDSTLTPFGEELGENKMTVKMITTTDIAGQSVLRLVLQSGNAVVADRFYVALFSALEQTRPLRSCHM